MTNVDIQLLNDTALLALQTTSDTTIGREIDQGLQVETITPSLSRRLTKRFRKRPAWMDADYEEFDESFVPKLQEMIGAISDLYTRELIGRRYKLGDLVLKTITTEAQTTCALLNRLMARHAPTFDNPHPLLDFIREHNYLKMVMRNTHQDLARLRMLGQAASRGECQGYYFASEMLNLMLTIGHAMNEIFALLGDTEKETKPMEVSHLTLAGARSFWRENFDDRQIVEWKEFYYAFITKGINDQLEARRDEVMRRLEKGAGRAEARRAAATHLIMTDHEKCVLQVELKRLVDITQDHCVSLYEFDLFSVLFQPWNRVLQVITWMAIRTPAFRLPCQMPESVVYLENLRKPRSYVYTQSREKSHLWQFSYFTTQGELVNRLTKEPMHEIILADLECRKEDRKFVFPLAKPLDPWGGNLKMLLAVRRQIVVTDEMDEPYRAVGTSYDACKLCVVRTKEVILMPCEHLLCFECWHFAKRENGRRCPLPKCNTFTVRVQGVEFDNLEDGVERSETTSLVGGWH